jgi:hypothetical protein
MLNFLFPEDNQSQNQNQTDNELDFFLLLPKLKLNDDVLGWWKLNVSTFPCLSSLVKQYFSIQASSSSSERTFSTGGNIYDEKRSNLKPENASTLVYLKKNFKFW